MAQRLPYPGLRAFGPEEADLFFGREGCVDSMVNRLASQRFLTVLGPSGSGKSSLVRTGLFDALEIGLYASAGSRWQIADFHPGGRVMGNLASALLASRGSVDGETLEADLLTTYLRRGPRAIAEWAADGNLEPATNLLILVDQFEELFRYSDYAQREEAEAFGALLIETARTPDRRLHVVLTMRSEYLGACALIPGLAERINDGIYLTPRMSREECRLAIEGPAGVIGFTVEPALVTRLLNDLAAFAPWEEEDGSSLAERLSRRADQLPLMQHVLNRLWARASMATSIDRITLRLEEYEAIGGLQGALNAHGAEIIASLAPEEVAIAETIFRALVSGDSPSAAVRRPARLGELVELAGGAREATLNVIRAFAAEDCNFLRVSGASLANDETIVDISHESLIRQWTSLSNWLEKEAQAARNWRRLSSAADLCARREGGLLMGLDLAVSSAWWAGENPTAKWAARHGGDYEATEAFLRRSQREEAARDLAEKKRQLRERNLLRIGVAGLTVSLVIVGSLGMFAYSLKDENARDLTRIEQEKNHAALELADAGLAAFEAGNLTDAYRERVSLLGLPEAERAQPAVDFAIQRLGSLSLTTVHPPSGAPGISLVAGPSGQVFVQDSRGDVYQFDPVRNLLNRRSAPIGRLLFTKQESGKVVGYTSSGARGSVGGPAVSAALANWSSQPLTSLADAPAGPISTEAVQRALPLLAAPGQDPVAQVIVDSRSNWLLARSAGGVANVIDLTASEPVMTVAANLGASGVCAPAPPRLAACLSQEGGLVWLGVGGNGQIVAQPTSGKFSHVYNVGPVIVAERSDGQLLVLNPGDGRTEMSLGVFRTDLQQPLALSPSVWILPFRGGQILSLEIQPNDVAVAGAGLSVAIPSGIEAAALVGSPRTLLLLDSVGAVKSLDLSALWFQDDPPGGTPSPAGPAATNAATMTLRLLPGVPSGSSVAMLGSRGPLAAVRRYGDGEVVATIRGRYWLLPEFSRGVAASTGQAQTGARDERLRAPDEALLAEFAQLTPDTQLPLVTSKQGSDLVLAQCGTGLVAVGFGGGLFAENGQRVSLAGWRYSHLPNLFAENASRPEMAVEDPEGHVRLIHLRTGREISAPFGALLGAQSLQFEDGLLVERARDRSASIRLP